MVCGVLGCLLLSSVDPITYIKKTFPALTFAFSSRSSAATIPLTIEAQTKGLGNDEGISNFAASIGASVGQNACAGLYPAMLAIMVTAGGAYDVSMVQLIIVIVISSLGVAGVGGGATNAALIVFGTLGLPVEIVALLISVEAIIDMGRTAINVNGAITAGTITSRLFAR